MKDIISKAKNTILENNLIKRGERILLAVSGGADSIAMLYIMRELSKDFAFSIGIASFNHKIRKEASNEVEFVENLCKSFDLEFYKDEFNIPHFAKLNKLSLEEASRIKRFEFLFEVKEKYSFDKVALAHNLDDLVETVIMNIVRGAGIKGLTGIKPKSFDGKIIHPLIEIERKEIENYLNSLNAKYFIDLTNYSLDYLRNRIRHVVIPILTSLNPNFKKEILNLSKIVQEENIFIEKIANIDLRSIKVDENSFLLNAFQRLPLFEKRRIISLILKEDADFNLVENVIKSLEKRKRKTNLKKDSYLISNGNIFWIEEKTPFTLKKTYSINIPGFTLVEEAGCKIEASFEQELPKDLTVYKVAFDYDKIKLPLKVRFRKEGDRILTESGTVKVKDLFINEKIRRDKRHTIPLIVDAEDSILWIAGVKRSSLYKVKGKNPRILLLKVYFN